MPGTTQNSPGPCRPAYLPRRSTTARSHCWAIFGDAAAISPSTIPTGSTAGRFHATAIATVGATIAASTRNEMTLTRGGSLGLRRSFRLSLLLVTSAIGLLPFHVDPAHLEEVDRLVGGEPQRGGVGQEAVRQRHQEP